MAYKKFPAEPDILENCCKKRGKERSVFEGSITTSLEPKPQRSVSRSAVSPANSAGVIRVPADGCYCCDARHFGRSESEQNVCRIGDAVSPGETFGRVEPASGNRLQGICSSVTRLLPPSVSDSGSMFWRTTLPGSVTLVTLKAEPQWKRTCTTRYMGSSVC